jgi:mycothiol synthase
VDVSLRPLGDDDVAVWVDLLDAVEEEDRTGEHFSADDLAEVLADPDVEVGKDAVGAFAADGALVGYWLVQPRVTDGQVTVDMQGAVLPALRGVGIGSALVTGMVERAVRARDERRPDLPARLVATGGASDDAQASLLATVGLRPERWTFVMRMSLDALPPAPPLPAGYRVRPYDGSMADAVRVAHNAAFVDLPGATSLSEERWRLSVTEARNFRPEVSFVASPAGSDEIAAYVQTAEFEADFAATGRREAYVAKVGTGRDHRGKGLAAALLGHTLRAYRAAGYDVAALAVDSENPTGALGVYGRVGFAVESRWAEYARTVGVTAG